MENVDKLIKAGRIVIKQYAYGTVRIDDGVAITNKANTQGDKKKGQTQDGSPRPYFPFGIVTDVLANGNVVPMIYLPKEESLIIDGQHVPVAPIGGGLARDFSPVPPGSDIFCAIGKNEKDKWVAQIYNGKAAIPNNSKFDFYVAQVPNARNLRQQRVKQFVCGTVFLSSDKGMFAIVADPPSGAGTEENDPISWEELVQIINAEVAAAEAADADSDSSETEYIDPYPPGPGEEYYNRTHHLENCYCLMGETLRDVSIPDTQKVEDFVGQFLCLKIPATANSNENPVLIGFDTLSELQEAQKDPAYSIRPLYKLDENGSAVVDFRYGPRAQFAEVL